jgi:hypothetical protein
MTTPEVTGQGLFPAEHRALRELYATARQLERHWSRLAAGIGTPAAGALEDGAAAARALLAELDARAGAHDLHGFPAATGVGGRLADVRSTVGDFMLERNQALRLALLDVQHVRTLLAYAAALADTRGDPVLAGFHHGWEARLEPVEAAARAAATEQGRDPEGAIQPSQPGPLGRAGQRLGAAAGTAGEAFDASALGRFARRVTRRDG